MTDYEEVTLKITQRTREAADEVAVLTGDTETDSWNRAMQVYCFIERVMRTGTDVVLYRKTQRPWWQRLLGYPKYTAEKFEYD